MHRFHHWRVQIEDARDQRTLARVIQDYRLTLTPAMVKSLPVECREAVERNDIPDVALKCLEAEMRCQGTPELTNLLHEVAHTYAAAAVKLNALRDRRI